MYPACLAIYVQHFTLKQNKLTQVVLLTLSEGLTYVAFSLVQMEPLVSTGELVLKTLSVRSMKVWFL